MTVEPVDEELPESEWPVRLTKQRHAELLAAEAGYRDALPRLELLDQMAGELQTARQEHAIAQARVVELTLELDVEKAKHTVKIPAETGSKSVTVTIQIGA